MNIHKAIAPTCPLVVSCLMTPDLCQTPPYCSLPKRPSWSVTLLPSALLIICQGLVKRRFKCDILAPSKDRDFTKVWKPETWAPSIGILAGQIWHLHVSVLNSVKSSLAAYMRDEEKRKSPRRVKKMDSLCGFTGRRPAISERTW